MIYKNVIVINSIINPYTLSFQIGSVILFIYLFIFQFSKSLDSTTFIIDNNNKQCLLCIKLAY